MNNNYEYHRIPSVEMEEQINNYDNNNNNTDEHLLLSSSTLKENDDLFPIPLDAIDTIQQSKNSVSFDLTFCNRFLHICRILFSPLNPYGNLISILFSFFIISLAFEVVVYFVGTIPSRFYTVLIGQDFEGFKYELIWGMGFVLSAGLVNQRIAQDIDKFATKLREIAEEVLVSPIIIAYYTYQTWKLCGYLGPLMIYSYFFISFISSRFLISPIVNLVFMKEFYEGNYRFLHIRIRQFSESIAFGLAILSYIMIAIPIFTGVYDNIEKEKLDLAGYTSRIGQLLEALEEINMELENVDIDNPFNDPPRPPSSELSIIFDQVTIMTPSGNKLLSEFKFMIEQENNVMIIGPNGSGKSSILRVMCGLWSTPKGHVIKPYSLSNQQRILIYLPQTPYLVFGSLRDQLSYPMINDEKNQYVTDEEVDNLLSLVNLSHVKSLVRNYDEQYGSDWDKMLSPGEIQRLSFARLFYWKPTFAALDESTSSLDAATESNFFEKYGKGHYATSDIDINGTENIERWIDGIL
ncbi:11700_t:CDS:2, partial [Diversispora eburnea]